MFDEHNYLINVTICLSFTAFGYELYL